MNENCYITSTKTTHAHRKHEIIGPCGPCSFINLTRTKGSFEFEKELAEKGRLRPFHASGYTAFLVWGHLYKKDLKVYTSSKRISNKKFQLMIRYENVPTKKIRRYKEMARKRHESVTTTYSDHVKVIKNPLNTLHELLEQEYRVAVLTSDAYFTKNKPVPHWIVVFKREKNTYWCCDSSNGVITLTKKQILDGWNLNKSVGFSAQLVAYKE
jgi:rRNA-processing protein FCF1